LLSEVNFDYNLKRIMCTSHEDLCKFIVNSHAVFLRMRNALDKICRENQNTYFMFSIFFYENRAVFERHAIDDNMIQCRIDVI